MTIDSPSNEVVILNPTSCSDQDFDLVRKHVELKGYGLKVTGEAGDAIRYARDAANDGSSTLVAAGGDGTVNEVISGIHKAGAFDRVSLGVIPLGTGNNFAKNIGVGDIQSSFRVLEEGEPRRIDVGSADSRLFVNSFVAGLTADSSSETSRDMKNRLGVLAYVLTTLRSLSEFQPFHLAVELNDSAGMIAWAGEAICVLVGNGRRFTARGSTQANMEDGLFEVVVIEGVPALDLMSETVVDQLFELGSSHVIRFRSSDLSISIRKPESIRFSLDGEIIERGEITLQIRPRILEVFVGPSYTPDPDPHEPPTGN